MEVRLITQKDRKVIFITPLQIYFENFFFNKILKKSEK